MTGFHDDTVRREFAKQATHFGDAGLTLSSEDLLRWSVDALAPEVDSRVLDVAAGTGHLARALAPRVAHVTAVDLTPEMLAEGRRAAAGAGLSNLAFEEGHAESLRYGDGAFDLVVTRLSFHHLADPRPAVRQMARVCRPGGRVGVVDLLSPEDRAVAERYNGVERLRDPSHTRALTRDELVELIRAAGLTVADVQVRVVEVNVARWLDMTHPSADARRAVLATLEGELGGGPATGMRPFRRDDGLRFLHTWAVVVAWKP